jgi:hypothetical protein
MLERGLVGSTEMAWWNRKKAADPPASVHRIIGSVDVRSGTVLIADPMFHWT